ncbi:hypothetical protein P8452_55843 [Trifolium repens]|nr:hypothetical protein P8452_55843 [Trifolium repens]
MSGYHFNPRNGYEYEFIQKMKKIQEQIKKGCSCRPNMVIKHSFDAPIVANDGVTVAKRIEFKDQVRNSTLMKITCSKQNSGCTEI